MVLPSRVAGLYAAQGGLKALPLPVDVPSFEVRLHWHPRQEGVTAHRWIPAQVLRNAAQSRLARAVKPPAAGQHQVPPAGAEMQL